jgi:predicted porin
MQKKLLTVAVASALAMPAVALAQVTVYGTIDTGLRSASKVVVGANNESLMTVTDGNRTTNRWGLKGTEDLGGGMNANFTLEGQYASDIGGGPGSATPANQGLFQRKSIVGLSSGGNSVDLGRDYTVNFKAQGIYDPMSYTYTGITPSAGTNVAGTRSSNMVTAGFRFGTGGVRVDYGMSETPDDPFGTSTGFMADYAFGPVTLTGALSTVDTSATTSVDTTNFGVAWKLGALTLRAGVSNTETETGVSTADTETPMLVLGVQYAISPTWNGRIGYYDTKFKTGGVEMGTRKVTIVAMDYVMSKRTTAYFAFDRTGITGTAPNTVLGVASVDGATGISAGIAHAF